MNLTIKQRSQLVRAAERGLSPRPSRADTIVAVVGVVGCVALVAMAYWGAI